MAFTKTVADADNFFLPNNHIQAYEWRKYSTTDKTAAFTQALRELQANQGREMQDPATTDTYRDDYAVFSQALWILERTPRQLMDGQDEVIDITKDDEKKNVERKGILICPEAKMYLGRSSIKMVRG